MLLKEFVQMFFLGHHEAKEFCSVESLSSVIFLRLSLLYGSIGG